MAAGKKTMKNDMQLQEDVKTFVFRSGKWIVVCVDHDDLYEYYLTYENYGIVEHEFGVQKKDYSWMSFLDLVKANFYRDKVLFAYAHEEDEFEI